MRLIGSRKNVRFWLLVSKYVVYEYSCFLEFTVSLFHTLWIFIYETLGVMCFENCLFCVEILVYFYWCLLYLVKPDFSWWCNKICCVFYWFFIFLSILSNYLLPLRFSLFCIPCLFKTRLSAYALYFSTLHRWIAFSYFHSFFIRTTGLNEKTIKFLKNHSS